MTTRSDQRQLAGQRPQRWHGEQPFCRCGSRAGGVKVSSRVGVTQRPQKRTLGSHLGPPQARAAQMCTPGTRGLVGPEKGLRLCVSNNSQ